MKLLILMLCILLANLSNADDDSQQRQLCVESTEECHSTDYESYVKCVRRRQKRSTCRSSCDSGDCYDSCDTCDCDSCSYSSCNSCNACCTSCCSNFVSCRTHHCCHKTCHAQCQTSGCRSTCRKNCFTSVNEKEVSTGESSNPIQNSSTNIANNVRHNITTIINLNNVINNTNIVDVPITLNNTNMQNITLYQAGAQAEAEKCCTVISPRQCVSTPKPRCFHYRSKQCGAFCTAGIVHKEQQQVCESMYPGAPPSCRQQVIYIPQPQPRCVYQAAWPYVSCGVRRSETCHGCYSHYVDQSSLNYLACPSQCYDQGYAAGSYYRQGPVYQPGYFHAPCFGCGGMSMGIGMGMGMPTPYGMMGGYPYPSYPANIPFAGSPYPSYPIYQPPSYFDGVNFTSGVQGEIDQYPVPLLGDPLRSTRDLEIEVEYEIPSDAQAEVKIQQEEEEEEEIGKEFEENKTPTAASEEAVSVKQA